MNYQLYVRNYSRNTRKGWICETQVCANYRLKWARHQARLLFPTRWRRIAIVICRKGCLDVLNGKQGSLNNNGYIVNAGDSLAIKGFRKDKHTEAAFQFANVADSYAANSVE